MAILIFLVVVVIITTIVCGIKHDSGVAFLGFLGSSFCCAFLLFILTCFTLLIPHGYQDYSTERIYALKDNMTTSGSFFLGCGQVEGEMRYYYMVQDDVGYYMDSKRASVTRIVEGEDKPYIQVQRGEYNNPIWHSIVFNIRGEDFRYIFHIPKGSIDYSYKVDME